MAEAVSAMKLMGAARHIGKIVLANSPMETGQLREDRTYLVTGCLGGIGCVLAGREAERGAGAIVLNGRRDPTPKQSKPSTRYASASASAFGMSGTNAHVVVEGY